MVDEKDGHGIGRRYESAPSVDRSSGIMDAGMVGVPRGSRKASLEAL
jgi:hypothetical protein